VEDGVVQQLVASLRCSSCGHRYPAENVAVLGEEDGLWLLRAVCGACHVGAIVAAILREAEPGTDLTPAERVKFRRLGPVTGEDLMAARDFLDRFRGDVAGLFPPGPEGG
jgi:hypothetical protein